MIDLLIQKTNPVRSKALGIWVVCTREMYVTHSDRTNGQSIVIGRAQKGIALFCGDGGPGGSGKSNFRGEITDRKG
jgi:hypothetical protein